MAQITFEMVGKIRLARATDKFSPYREQKFDSGWANKTLIFNMVCGDNRHMLQIQGGTYPDDKNYKIKTFGPSTVDENGKRHAGEMVEIPWKDRFLESSINKVAEFRKYIVDLEQHGRRRLLEQYDQRIHEGVSITDEELKSVGLNEESEIKEELEKSRKRKHEFITAWDQAEFMKKVIDSGKYENKKFYIRGNYTCQWSDMKQQWYINMTPQRIYLASDDAEEYGKGNATLFFGPDAVDDMSLEEKGKYYVKAYTMEYDSVRKKNIPCEFHLVIPGKMPDKNGVSDDKDELRAKRVVQKFVVDDDSVKEYGIEFDILNGAQRVEITQDMLTEEQQEDLELGLITMDDIRRDLGSTVYGDRVVENLYTGVARGYTKGRKDTAYTLNDLVVQPINQENDDDALFDDDDII